MLRFGFYRLSPIILVTVVLIIPGCGNDGGANTDGETDPLSYQIALTFNSGGGSISFEPSGETCTTTCSFDYTSGTQVTLHAIPDGGYVFNGWGGACGGMTDCVLVVDQDRIITASFTPGNTANLCDGLITDKLNHPMTNLAKPAQGTAVTDPQFGTTIRRISSAQPGAVIKPVYSTVQAWNADETYLILYHTGGNDSGHHLYNGKTYTHIRALDIHPPDLEQLFWSTVDPDILFYIDNSATPSLIRYHVSTETRDTAHQFSHCDAVHSGSDPMFTSWDSNVFGLMCQSGGKRYRFSYRVDTHAESPMVSTSGGTAPQASPTGNLFFFAGDGDAQILDTNNSVVRTLDIGSPYDHASLGMLADGTDTFYGVDFNGGASCGTGTLVAHNMTNGDCRVIVGEATGYPYPPSGTHISAIAYKKPGWVAASMVGYDYDGQSVLDNEIILTDTNPGGDVCRIAHHRSWGKAGAQGYWAEPHVTISPSGTRLLFGSDWGGTSTVDAYVIELPAYSP
jgi:hypothetical protein